MRNQVLERIEKLSIPQLRLVYNEMIPKLRHLYSCVAAHDVD